MPFYERGNVRIRYEMVGSGFPLLVTPGGGLNSRVSNWPTAVFNAMEACKDDFSCVTMDQRNATAARAPSHEPGGPRSPGRASRPICTTNLLGNPYDTGVAAARLIFGGVLDRFPKLFVCLPHAGGTLPYLIGRLDRGQKVRRELKHVKRRPSAYLRRFTYDTISHAAAPLRYLIDLVGAARVMIGSDYCFDLGRKRPV